MAIDKKKKITITVIVIIIVLFILISTLVLINLKKSNKLSSEEELFITEAVLLANEVEGNERYTYDSQEEYENLISDINPHMLNVEVFIYTPELSYERKDNDPEYDYSGVLTCYGLNSEKMTYNIFYNEDYSGKIETLNNTFIINVSESSLLISSGSDTYKIERTKQDIYNILRNDIYLVTYDLTTKEGISFETSTRTYKGIQESKKIDVSYQILDVPYFVEVSRAGTLYSYEVKATPINK